ncbi:hypothetical protein BUALT_Bualt01G0043600 [Buddleja alternifolia]|uniref:Uncharacterized protein n=1 Tax=Buddleja alternifolia TaxID=168488 RepID=A0AAV6YEY2_9LAMI|nr:hypothetical protein BUALT_Bualt01G0043600 [Buddleja alternifolia]
MALTTHHTLKKTYFYNFFPTKAMEEASLANPNPAGVGHQRMLVEIRDVYPPPVLDSRHPWQIKKTLNAYEISSGKVLVSFQDTFEYILRYWTFCMANNIAMLGKKVLVVLWDLTDEKNPKKYEGNEVYFQMILTGDCVLSCMEMMRNRNLKVDDYIAFSPAGEAIVLDPFSLDIWDPFEVFPLSTSVADLPASTRETTAMANTRIDWRETPEAYVFKSDLPVVHEFGRKSNDLFCMGAFIFDFE